MPEMLGATMALKMKGLKKAALVTDGRFSGATSGPCVGHVCPEASDGGPIALIEDGDLVEIDAFLDEVGKAIGQLQAHLHLRVTGEKGADMRRHILPAESDGKRDLDRSARLIGALGQ